LLESVELIQMEL